MPEGQAIHRHARILSGLFAGRPVTVSSPQGRFAAGAELLQGLTPLRAEAWGKHFFMPFVELSTLAESAPAELSEPTEPEPADLSAPADSIAISLGDDGPLWLHVHLGLYGKWTFSGPRARELPANLRGGGAASPIAEPGPNVRLRIETPDIAADLSGPTRCEVLDGASVRRALAKLGPDPIRNEPGDRERFIEAVRSRRAPVGQLVLDQAVSAGPGNIYRADCLFRTGISPMRPGQRLSRQRAAALWADLVATMSADVDDGVITTVPGELRPEPVPPDDPEAARFAVYHRTGRPCLRCGTAIAEKDMAGRRLFWCPGCQR